MREFFSSIKSFAFKQDISISNTAICKHSLEACLLHIGNMWCGRPISWRYALSTLIKAIQSLPEYYVWK